MYNVLTRDLEREIVPVARAFGLRLHVYNPLAGGLLTGRYQEVKDIEGAQAGRFSSEFDLAFGDKSKAGTGLYRARYAKEPILNGVALLQAALGGGPPDSNV